MIKKRESLYKIYKNNNNLLSKELVDSFSKEKL